MTAKKTGGTKKGWDHRGNSSSSPRKTGKNSSSTKNRSYPVDDQEAGHSSKRAIPYDKRKGKGGGYSPGGSKTTGSYSKDDYHSGNTSQGGSAYEEGYSNHDRYPSGDSKTTGSYSKDDYHSGNTSQGGSAYEKRYSNDDRYSSEDSKTTGSYSKDDYHSGNTSQGGSAYEERYSNDDRYPSGDSKTTGSYSKDDDYYSGNTSKEGSTYERSSGSRRYTLEDSEDRGLYSNDDYYSGNTSKEDPVIKERHTTTSSTAEMSTEEVRRLRVHFRNSYEEFRQEVISPTTQDRGRGLGRWVVYRSDRNFPVRLIEAPPAHLRIIHQQLRSLSLRQGHLIELQVTIIRENGIARRLRIVSLNPKIIDFGDEGDFVAPAEFRNLPERSTDAHHKLLRGMNRLFSSSYGLERPGDRSYGDSRVAAMPWLSRINGFVHGIYRILNTRVSNRFMNDQTLMVSRSLISSQNDHADSFRSGGDLAVSLWNSDLSEPERWGIREPSAKCDVLLRIIRNYMDEDIRINGQIMKSREWESIYQGLLSDR